MKTFQEFITEVRKYTKTRSKEDAEKLRQSKEDPSLYRLKNRQTTETPYWGLEPRAKQKEQRQRRASSLRPITYQEILSAVKRDLSVPNSEVRSVARKAHNDEVAKKTAQTREATKQTKETGIKHVVDHSQPQQNERKPKYKARFQAVVPGDVSSNRTVVSEPDNLAKGSKPPKKGEPGYGSTRSGAISKLIIQNKPKKEQV